MGDTPCPINPSLLARGKVPREKTPPPPLLHSAVTDALGSVTTFVTCSTNFAMTTTATTTDKGQAQTTAAKGDAANPPAANLKKNQEQQMQQSRQQQHHNLAAAAAAAAIQSLHFAAPPTMPMVHLSNGVVHDAMASMPYEQSNDPGWCAPAIRPGASVPST